ncbi:MAG TPA: hypothetical protein VH724_06985 [Candidatus Angelobacter sp.]|nr:hypothetical protein [Candidatus Angelobacter sp.]
MLVFFALAAVAIKAQTPADGKNGASQSVNTNSASQPSGAMPAANTASEQNPPQSSSSTAVNPSAATDQISAGTEIRATLDTPLSTRTSQPGDRFTATISDSAGVSNGLAVIPGGSRVEGEVAQADDNKTLAALRGKGKLSLRFRDVVLLNGQTLPLTATLISVHDTGSKSTKRTSDGGREQSGARGKEAGAIAGFGGPLKGLAVGALPGGGYVLATNGKDVNLPAQTGMVIRLDQSVSSNTSSPQQ